MSQKDFYQLLQRAQEAGCTITRSSHGWRIETPNGPVFTSFTPSDRRVMKKVRAQLRQRGVKV